MAITSTDEPLLAGTSLAEPNRDATHVENVARVVEIAARTEGIPLAPAEVARTAMRIHADFGRGRHAFVTLAATCVEHGLSTSLLRESSDELLERLDEGVTLVIEQGEGSQSLIVLSAPTGSTRILCHVVAGGRARRTARSVQRVLRSMDGELMNALAIEPSFPLDILRTPDGGPSGAFRKLWALARLERSELTTVLVYAAIIGVLTLMMPVSVQALVNTIAFGSVLQPLVILGLALFAALVLSAVLQTLRDYVVEVLQRRVFARVVNDFGRRLPRWSAAAHREGDLRELSNRFFDVVTIQKSAASLAIDGLGLALQTAVGLLLLAFYHPVLLAFDVVLVLALLGLILLPLRRSAESAIYESKAKYATAAWLQSIAAHPTLFSDAMGARQASARAEAMSRLYLERRAAHWRHLLQQIAGGLALYVIASVALLLIGGWLVMQRQLTLGQLVASELVVAVIGAGFVKLGKQMEKLYDAAAAVDKVSQVVDVPRERDGGLQVRTVGPARIELREVSDPRLASDVDVTVEPGETIAIVGGAATGKSSLLELVTGRSAPASGSVRIDHVDLEQADLRQLRTSICALDAETRFPNMTIAELLRLHAPNASTTAMRAALEEVGLSGAVERLPGGLDERLLPHGPLSRTEMLRLSVARLLLQKPRIALLDGTLDALVEQPALLDAVLGGPWTTLVATASEAVISRAHRTLQLVATEARGEK